MSIPKKKTVERDHVTLVYYCNSLLQTCNKGIQGHSAKMQENETESFRNMF